MGTTGRSFDILEQQQIQEYIKIRFIIGHTLT